MAVLRGPLMMCERQKSKVDSLSLLHKKKSLDGQKTDKKNDNASIISQQSRHNFRMNFDKKIVKGTIYCTKTLIFASNFAIELVLIRLCNVQKT